jgi:hypothetical protein
MAKQKVDSKVVRLANQKVEPKADARAGTMAARKAGTMAAWKADRWAQEWVEAGHLPESKWKPQGRKV